MSEIVPPMTPLASHKVRLRFKGGVADDGMLPGYDGTASLHGFVQALSIVTHAYTRNEVVSRATALKGARLVLLPPKKGSFIAEFVVLLEAYPAASSVAAAIGAPVFYDFLKFSLSRAVGLLNVEPETKYVKKLVKKDEPFFDELAETLEGSLQRTHRPLGGQTRIAWVERPRKRLLELNGDTKDWVETRDESNLGEKFIGNVTRYNSISRNGRAYIEEIGRVIPFRPNGNFPSPDLRHLTWSLHGSNTAGNSKLSLKAKPVTSASGKVKRILLVDVKRLV